MARDEAEVISIAEQRAARDARAGARTRSRCSAETAEGRPCRNYAVEDGRCRVHAVRSPTSAAAEDVPWTPASSDGAAAGRHAPAGDPAVAEPEAAAAPSGRAADAAARAADAAARAAGSSGGRGPQDPAFRRAAEELGRRGLGRPIDALAALRDLTGDRWLDHVRQAAAFVRRRVTGDYPIDEYGFDEDLTTHVLLPLLRPLHRYYWRVSSHGAEHVPAAGNGGLLVANHAGTLPADALITSLDLHDHTGRHARQLAADLALRTPFVGELARKAGATLASGDDADRLLAGGELVAVWPEGYKGLGKPWKDRYRLQRFGRGGFVATALRAQVPIVPIAIVGSEEIYPLLFDLRVVAKLFGLPYFPVVPQLATLPLLGPFALLPLPSKWVIEYGDPIETTDLGPDAADDPMLVFDLTDRVRDTIQRMINRNLMGRRSVFL